MGGGGGAEIWDMGSGAEMLRWDYDFMGGAGAMILWVRLMVCCDLGNFLFLC